MGRSALFQGQKAVAFQLFITGSHGSIEQFPIIKSTHHLLPSPDGELAPAIHAVLDVFGTPVNVIVVHNGQGMSCIVP